MDIIAKDFFAMHIDSTDTTLKRYLEDIRRTAPLSREEEQILFQRAKEGDTHHGGCGNCGN